MAWHLATEIEISKLNYITTVMNNDRRWRIPFRTVLRVEFTCISNTRGSVSECFIKRLNLTTGNIFLRHFWSVHISFSSDINHVNIICMISFELLLMS